MRNLSRVTSLHLFCVFSYIRDLSAELRWRVNAFSHTQTRTHTWQLQTPGSASSISVTKKKAIYAPRSLSSLTSTLDSSLFSSLFQKRVLRVTGPHAVFHNPDQMARQMVEAATSSLKSFVHSQTIKHLIKKCRIETSPSKHESQMLENTQRTCDQAEKALRRCRDTKKAGNLLL